MKKLLQLLEENCAYTTEQLAALSGMKEEEVVNALANFKKQGVLLGNQAVINWDKSEFDCITALIEVSITPQMNDGYEKIAKKIYQYDEVESIYLMSGAFDFCVIISGRSLKEVALFVSSKLSTIDGVTKTATHFILKKYKEKHVIFEKDGKQEERFAFD